MSSVSQEDEFTEVYRKRKKRKALSFQLSYASNPAGD